MRFDTKLAIVVRDDLRTWQKLNVTAFLAGAVAAGSDEVIGEPYEDASGRKHLAMFAQPVLVFVGSAEQLTTAYARAVAHQARLGIFTEELFGTDNDATTGPRSRRPPPIRCGWLGSPCTTSGAWSTRSSAACGSIPSPRPLARWCSVAGGHPRRRSARPGRVGLAHPPVRAMNRHPGRAAVQRQGTMRRGGCVESAHTGWSRPRSGRPG